MKTGNLGNVAVSTPELKRSSFPWSKNAYTTCGFGEVQPLKCQWCDSDSVNDLSIENLTYLGDLVSPTYGKVNVEFWHYFVAMRDMFDNFDRFLAKTPAQSGGAATLQRYMQLPHISAGVLSLLPLIGAHCTAYKVTQDFGNNRAVRLPVWKMEDTASQTAAAGEFSGLQTVVYQAVRNWMAESTGGNPNKFMPNSKVQTKIMPFPTMCLDVRCLLPADVGNNMRKLTFGSPSDYCWLPLSNPDWASFFEVQDANGATVLTQEGVDIAPVSLQEGGYDFLIEIGGGSVDRWILAFRMHAFGRRLHKLLTGSNFTPDLSSTENVSFMPIMAVWKAYFDCFGLTLYENFDMTPVGRLLKYYNSACSTMSLDTIFATRDSAGEITDYEDLRLVTNLSAQIVRDLGSMWYTDSQDYVSMQQRSPTVAITMDNAFINRLNPAPVGNESQNGVTVPNSDIGFTPVDDSHIDVAPGNTSTQHAYINKIRHGQFDANVIKMLYLQTNNSTIAGKRLEKILRAMGYGKWLEHQKPRFIGHDVVEIDFNQVISTANTEDGSKGSGVGARGGRGQGYGQCKTHKYHNDEAGFLITLCSVVPHSGYSQGLNPAFRIVKPEDVYTPLIDGLSMEATEVRDICGDRPVVLLDSNGAHRKNETSRTFGFAPQCSRLKREQNTYSGGFARKSKRDYFLTFCLDKFIDVGATALMTQDAQPQQEDTGLLHRDATFTQIFVPEDFALSGNHWRYPTRYPWLGNFNRIFAMLGDDQQNYYGVINNATNLFSYWEYFNNEDDGFIVMCVVNQKNDMRKKPISDSFETFDEDNPISTNISKA